MDDNCGDAKSQASGPGRRVLLVAYAYSPTKGSEYRHAWELSRELARHHDVTVLFGDSDGLMGSFASYDHYLKANTDTVTAVKVAVGPRRQALARLMLRMPFSLLFAYLLRSWHRDAYKTAAALHASRRFDVVHQLGPIGFRNPGYCWKLGAPSYWGPIGGAQYINLKMVRRKFSLYFLEALLRNIDVWLKQFSPYVRRAALNFDQVSFATPENQRYFEKHFNRRGIVISDQGLYDRAHPQRQETPVSSGLVVAWGGTLNARKNVDLLIAIAENAPADVTFQVMGDGPMRPAMEQAAAKNPRIKVLGLLGRDEVQEVLHQSDVILLTSLSEANTAILFEGMENGCVPVAPRINGFAACLNETFALTYPSETWDDTLNAAVGALTALLQPDVLAAKRQCLEREMTNLTWKALATKHMNHYG